MENAPVALNNNSAVTAHAGQAVAQSSFFTNLEAFEAGQRICKMLSSSSLVPTAYQGNIANTFIALEMATRTGSSPLAVMQNLYIVHGRPAWSAQFVIAALNACGKFSPLRFEIAGEGDKRTCKAWAVEHGTGERLEGPPVSVEMAKAEGWYGKNGSKWQTMPELMLRYRAATFFGRLYAPDILMGMRTSEELHDTMDGGAEQNGLQTTTNAADDVDSLLATSPAEVIDTTTGELKPAEKAQQAEQDEPAPQVEEDPMAEYTRAMQGYMLQIDKIDNVSEATWWVNKQGKKLVDDLGGKNGECYLAIVEYAAEHTRKLHAQLKRKERLKEKDVEPKQHPQGHNKEDQREAYF